MISMNKRKETDRNQGVKSKDHSIDQSTTTLNLNISLIGAHYQKPLMITKDG
jgi:hypothetical protein